MSIDYKDAELLSVATLAAFNVQLDARLREGKWPVGPVNIFNDHAEDTFQLTLLTPRYRRTLPKLSGGQLISCNVADLAAQLDSLVASRRCTLILTSPRSSLIEAVVGYLD
jgi:hypothetical protein